MSFEKRIHSLKDLKAAFYKVFPSVSNCDLYLKQEVYEAKDTSKAEDIVTSLEAADTAIQIERSSAEYKELRSKAYPSIQDQLDMIYHDREKGTHTWEESIKEVKEKFPKPTEQI